MDSRLVVRRHQPVSCIFRGSCGGGGVAGGPRVEQAGGAGELLNALGLWKEAV